MPDITSLATDVARDGYGSQVAFKLEAEGQFKKINGVHTIPQVGAEAEIEENTAIDKTAPSYRAKMKKGGEFTLSFDDLPGDEDQEALVVQANALAKVPCQVTYSTGRIATFDVRFGGHYAEEAATEDKVMHAVKGQIDGDVVWTTVELPPPPDPE
jgi:hypothetical protein